jgi:hypothetical protein
LVNEFWKGRNAVERAIEVYRKHMGKGDLHPEQEPRKAMP